MKALNNPLVLLCFVLSVGVLAGCDSPQAEVLLFSGTGVSENDVVAIEVILKANDMSYALINSAGVNELTPSQLTNYKLLIVPGGNFIDMGKSLTTQASSNVRDAVHSGLNYFGICAGAFLAGNSEYYNGFNLTSGVTFHFYSAADKGLRKLAVAITTPGAPVLDQYWEDGPELSGWGEVIAKYPDGTPAVSQGKYGRGFVLLAGIHAEAPENWRKGMGFNTPASVDHEYAGRLISAALEGREMEGY
ncbi:MAG: BPL-N domain-containing protein [Bacteroidota bacterium]